MPYLVTMTTYVPDGTPGQAVAGVRTREAVWPRRTVQATPLAGPQGDPAQSIP
jgi:muconolactone delta-isomerase